MGAASEGESVSPLVTYKQLMEMERRHAARLEEVVKVLTRPTNFMIGTTGGAMLVNFLSGLLLIWFVKGSCYLAELARARFLIKYYHVLHNKTHSGKCTTDVVDTSEAASAFVVVTICEGSTNTLDIERQKRELCMRKKVREPLKGIKIKRLKMKAAHCDKAECSHSLEECPDSSKESPALADANVSVSIGMLMPSTTLTTDDEQAQELQKQAPNILLPHVTQIRPLEPGSIFFSATVIVAASAMDDLLRCAKRLLEKGRQLDPQCTVQLGAAALLYSTTGENVELVLLEEGIHDVPIITSAQKFGKKTILIKGFYLENTEIKATTSFEKSVYLNLVYHQKLANGMDLLLAQLPQGELLGSKSFAYVNKTIFLDNCTHPLVLRSNGKEIDAYKHKSTIFGTLCRRQFWICLVLLYIYQVVVFQPWRDIFVGSIFQLIISFLSCFLVEYIIIPWKFNIFIQWIEFMRSIMEMEGSNNSMSNLILSEPNMVIPKNTKRDIKNSDAEESDDDLESDDNSKDTDLETNDETVNDANWEWRCYERFLRKGRWVRKRAAAKDCQNENVRGRPFDVVTTVNRDGSQFVQLIVHSRQLVQILRDCQPNTDAAFSEGSSIDPDELFFRRKALKAFVDENYDAMLSGHADAQLSASVWHVRHVLRFVERHFADTLVRYEHMQVEKRVSFDMLWAFFMPGDGVCHRCPVTNQECFATVKRRAVIIESFQGPPTCHVTLNVMDFNVTSYYKCNQTCKIPAFEGEIPFTSLQVCPLHFFPNHKDMEARFVSVGNIFYEVAMRQPFRFMQFKGSLNFYHTEGGCVTLRKLNADGRVMIDLLSFARMNPGYPLQNADPPCEVMVGMWTPEQGQMKKPSDEELKLAPAFAYGFSFRLKKWGCFELCGLHDIIFNQGAFDALQLRKDSQKAILWSMVQQYVTNGGGSTRMQNDLDPIAYKGTGCIVLCHGPPGTGKTLTAEALAETLQCPLWSISAFELGDEPDTVEATLSQIMEIAHTWHAILLLDEADVYLEKRDEGVDVKRNLLTSVFLRMLEYYRGIMFLTTNRVSAFDDAILSRTTLAISYPALDDTQRRSIWMRLLTRAGIYDATYDAFLHLNLNGRQIRNIIHLAQLLARGQKQQFNISHVLHAIDAVTEGTKELLSTPSS